MARAALRQLVPDFYERHHRVCSYRLRLVSRMTLIHCGAQLSTSGVPFKHLAPLLTAAVRESMKVTFGHQGTLMNKHGAAPSKAAIPLDVVLPHIIGRPVEGRSEGTGTSKHQSGLLHSSCPGLISHEYPSLMPEQAPIDIFIRPLMLKVGWFLCEKEVGNVLGRYLVLRLNRARPILSLAPFPLFFRTELTPFFHTDDLLYRAGLKVSADSSRSRRRRKVLERKLEDDLARTCRSSLG